MIYLKMINAQKAKATNAYKNTKEKQHTMFIIYFYTFMRISEVSMLAKLC